MGLDMYAYAVKNTALNKFDTDIELPETGKEGSFAGEGEILR